MKIAFLGLGKMGTPMACRLLAAGHELIAWNRTPGRAAPLQAAGARLAASPAEAVRTADAVLTMLFDDAAHEAVLFGPDGALDAMPPGALHIVMSTISVAFSQRLTEEHARRNRPFVAAPVFGRPNVAEEGRLWIVVAGDDAAVSRARPILEPLSRGITVLGNQPSQAHALKLGGNFLISAMIHSLGESFVYASSQGIEPGIFLDTVNSALFQSPFYAAYGNVMLNPPEQPGATMELGAKDLSLLREAAAASQTTLSLAEDLGAVFAEACAAGLADEDWAVGQYKMAQMRGKPKCSN
jgi:3-hydroxyisobutyrate dehydrogenase-like beta-hydroxyacid dehydrogenase